MEVGTWGMDKANGAYKVIHKINYYEAIMAWFPFSTLVVYNYIAHDDWSEPTYAELGHMEVYVKDLKFEVDNVCNVMQSISPCSS
jgi:hypothetical protein